MDRFERLCSSPPNAPEVFSVAWMLLFWESGYGVHFPTGYGSLPGRHDPTERAEVAVELHWPLPE